MGSNSSSSKYGTTTSYSPSSSSLVQRSNHNYNNNNNKRTRRRKVTCSRNICCFGAVAYRNVVGIFLVVIGCIVSLMWQQQRLGKGGFDLSRYYQYYDVLTTSLNSVHEQHEQSSPSLTCNNPMEENDVVASFCRQWQGRGTAASLWMLNRDKILQASLHPLDMRNQHAAWTRALFDLVTAHPTQHLQRAWRTRPRPDHIHRILDIVQQRMTFLERQKLENPGYAGKDPPGSPPPLRIAIFGGSVTEGTKCEWLPDVILEKFPTNDTGGWRTEIKGNTCAWPFRFQLLLDHFLGPRVVQVHNLAVGGTSSTLALPTLKYWLYPRHDLLLGSGPDIIINAYAANDNLFSWDPNANGTATMDNFYESLQRMEEFCRIVLLSKPCHAHAPILGFVSEYQGNLNELLLAEDIRADTIRLLSEYYDFFDLSPATVVRKLVLVDADETLLSPSWYKPRGPRQPKNTPLERTKDSHYGMPGHVYTAWTMAYAVLSMVVDHCDDMNDEQDNHQDFDILEEHNIEAASAVSAMNRFPPPLVTRDLMTIDRKKNIYDYQETNDSDRNGIPMKWRQQAMAAQQQENEYCRTSSKTQSPCPFVFVATPTGTTRNKVALNKYIRRFRVSSEGWASENDLRYGWQNKIGLIASKPGGTLHLRLANIQQKIRHVIIQSLKSYGEEWKDSEAQFNITVSNDHTNTTIIQQTQGDDNDDNMAEKTTSLTIQGFHDMNASIALPFTLDLGDKSASIGQTVDVKITLIGGKKFKIIAMMLCSR